MKTHAPEFASDVAVRPLEQFRQSQAWPLQGTWFFEPTRSLHNDLFELTPLSDRAKSKFEAEAAHVHTSLSAHHITSKMDFSSRLVSYEASSSEPPLLQKTDSRCRWCVL